MHYEGVLQGDSARVHALLTDEGFLSDCARDAGTIRHQVAVHRFGPETVVRVDATVSTERAPAVAQSFLGRTATSEHVFTWGRVRPDTWTADVQIRLESTRTARMVGQARLEPHASGAKLTVDGEVTVEVAFIGRQLALVAATALREALDAQTGQVNARLRASQSGARPVPGVAPTVPPAVQVNPSRRSGDGRSGSRSSAA